MPIPSSQLLVTAAGMAVPDEAYIGRTVLVFWPEEGQWFEGVIEESSPEGLNVVYEDGDTGAVTSVAGNPHVKVLRPSSSHPALKRGDRVKGLFDDGDWYRGTIKQASVDGGGFDIDFDDGDFRAAVPIQEIQLFEMVAAPSNNNDEDGYSNEADEANLAEKAKAWAGQDCPDSESDLSDGAADSAQKQRRRSREQRLQSESPQPQDAQGDLPAWAADAPSNVGQASDDGGDSEVAAGAFEDEEEPSFESARANSSNNHSHSGGFSAGPPLSSQDASRRSDLGSSNGRGHGEGAADDDDTAGADLVGANDQRPASQNLTGPSGAAAATPKTPFDRSHAARQASSGAFLSLLGETAGRGSEPGMMPLHACFSPPADSSSHALVTRLALQSAAQGVNTAASRPMTAPGASANAAGTTGATSTGRANRSASAGAAGIGSSAEASALAAVEPSVKLAVLQLRCAALEQRRWEREMIGSAWEGEASHKRGSGASEGPGHAPCGGPELAWRAVDLQILRANTSKSQRSSLGSSGGINNNSNSSPSNGGTGSSASHGRSEESGALWEALFQLRMRSVALCKLHFGPEPSLPLAQATCDLAKVYGAQGLWPQVEAHVAKALALLRDSDANAGIVNGGSGGGGGGGGGGLTHGSRSAPTTTAGDRPAMVRAARGCLAAFDCLRKCAQEHQGLVPWDALIGLVGEDDGVAAANAAAQAAAANKANAPAGGGARGGGSDDDENNAIIPVKLATPFGVRVNLPPQGSVAPLPRSGLARLDPGQQPVGVGGGPSSSNASGAAAADGGASSATNDKVAHSGQSSMVEAGATCVPFGGPLTSSSSGRPMTWGEAVGFLRRSHPGFQTMVQALEAGHRIDHVALLRLTFARCATSSMSASTSTSASAPAAANSSSNLPAHMASTNMAATTMGTTTNIAAAAAGGGGSDDGFSCGGSVCFPLVLASELERATSVRLALGTTVAEVLVQTLRDRAAQVSVVPLGFNGIDDEGDNGEGAAAELQSVPCTWEEFVAAYTVSLAHDTGQNSEEAGAAAERGFGLSGGGGGGLGHGGRWFPPGQAPLSGGNKRNDDGVGVGVGEEASLASGGSEASGGGGLLHRLVRGARKGGNGTRAYQAWLARLEIDLLTLDGQRLAAQGSLEAAEATLQRASTLLTEQGWAESLVACSTYVIAAEVQVQLHLRARVLKQKACVAAAETWLASDDGHAVWRGEVKRLLAEDRQAAIEASERGEERVRLPKLEVEYRARQALLAAHVQRLSSSSSGKNNNNGDDPGGYFDRAEEGLLRVWEVHEAMLGREHPGTAAACLSLGNLCVIHRDLRQAKLWFESAVAILDTCFGGRCVQVTAAAEAQFGHVEVKLQQLRQGAPRLHRAATFYLTTAQDALKVERQKRKDARETVVTSSSSSEKMSSGEGGGVGGGGSSGRDMDASKAMRRRLWHALKAHHLFTELGDLWLQEAKQASKAAGKENGNDGSTNHNDHDSTSCALEACSSYEQALKSVGAMHESGGEASADALKLLLGTLKSFGRALEQAGQWRRAADAFGQLRTLSSRLLGNNHKSTVAATSRAKAAAARAATTPLVQAAASSASARFGTTQEGGLLGGGTQMGVSLGAGTGTRQTSPLKKASSPAKSLTGEESWLN